MQDKGKVSAWLESYRNSRKKLFIATPL